MTDKPNRFYSKRQETKIANLLGGKRTANSGATTFDKGDVKGEHLLVEAKTLKSPQKSHSVQKEWLDKIQEEALARGKRLGVVAIDFGDNGHQYFVVRGDDFKMLYESWLQGGV